MRNISFALTTEQVRNQTKTVTRRTGWATLKPGTLLQPVVKGMGLKKGERVETIGGPIRVVGVRRERLTEIGTDPFYMEAECAREGFPSMSPSQFVEMFWRHNGCAINAEVTRIEFEYVDADGGKG
jgi:hypothetical protein